MDALELMKQGIKQLENPKESIPNTQELSKQSEQRIEQLIGQVPNRLSICGVPRKFIRMDLKGSLGLDLLKKGVCLSGKAGVGKTMAVCLLMRDWFLLKTKIIRDWYETRGVWEFIVYPEFIMQLQDTYSHEKNDETALEMLERVANCHYLVIDDLGAEKPTEYVRQATYYIINHREMHELPTFITTNFSMDYLDENIDSRISSRIAGMCEIIRMEGKDRRLARD